MREKQFRRSKAVFPIGTVMKLTDLTARQIRYYEEQKLVAPQRTETNRRMYSLNDVDRLLEIKDYLAEGFSIQAIHRFYNRSKDTKQDTQQLTEEDVRRILYNEFLAAGGFESAPGEYPRF